MFIKKRDSWLLEKYIAHRGLHDENIPENSKGSFLRAMEYNYPIEIDLQLTKDKEIVVFHDSSLKRMTGSDKLVMNCTLEELRKLNLAKSEEKIMTFREFLDLVNGKVEILIEIKNTGKVGELEHKTLSELRNYEGAYAIFSFNPLTMKWFRKNAPMVARGVLSSYFETEKLSLVKKILLKRMKLNFLAKPDFIAYDVRNIPNKYLKKYSALPILAWTVRSEEMHEKVKAYCDNIVFEGFMPTKKI